MSEVDVRFVTENMYIVWEGARSVVMHELVDVATVFLVPVASHWLAWE